MVRKARNKKRRAGRIGKTKLKNGTYSKFRPSLISDPVIKANWDRRKSPAHNLRNLGLAALPNADINSRGRDDTGIDNMMTLSNGNNDDNGIDKTAKELEQERKEKRKQCKAIELYDIPDSDIIPKKTLSQRMLPVSIEDQTFIVKCFEKYGTDYNKMKHDIKVNNMQLTENQLKKLGARFLLLEEKDRRVEIPEKIASLMSS